MNKGRAVLAPLLAVVGAGLLAYGLSSHSIAVSSKPASPAVAPAPGSDEAPGLTLVAAQVAPVSEAAVVQEVARGGVTRDESGQVKKTYEEGKQAPKACPT
jgi:hypothetical protein